MDLEREKAPSGSGFMTFEEVTRTLGRNRWILVLTTAAALGASYWWVSNQTQLYQGTAVVRLLDSRSALTGGMAGNSQARSGGSGADPILSEILVLRGRSVLPQVVDQLGLRLIDASGRMPPSWASAITVDLPDDAERSYRVRFGPETLSVAAISDAGSTEASTTDSVRYGASVVADGVHFTVPERPGFDSTTLYLLPRQAAIDRLDEMLTASPLRSTDALEVSVFSPDPDVATEVVNSVVLTYQRVNAASGREGAARRRAFLGSQLVEQDSLVALAEADLAAFRWGRQTYSSQERLLTEQAGMLAIETHRRELESDRRIYQSLLANLDDTDRWAGDYGVLVASPGIADNMVVTQYYTRLMNYQVQRDSLTAGPDGATAAYLPLQSLDSLIAQTEARLADALSGQVRALDARIDELVQLQAESASAMAGPLSAEAEEGRLLRRVEAARSLSDQLRAEVQLARVAAAAETGEVEIVELATRALPIDPRSVQKLLLGGTIGLLFGIAVAFFREAADMTVVRKEDVERLLGVEILAVIPQIRNNGRSREVLANGKRKRRYFMNGRTASGVTARAYDEIVRADPKAVHLIPNSGGVEAYRTLRTNLLFAPTAKPLRTLVVTSAAPSEGKTMTVANLGLSFARQGSKVLMIDGDLRRPDLARLVGLPKAPGLTDLLLSKADLRTAVRRTGVDGLSVIPSGYLSENSSELLCGRRMQELLDTLWFAYDVVLIDSAPLLATADAAVLGALSDGVLMVVRAGFVDKRATRQVREQLDHVGARLIGTVLNDPDGKLPEYGGYYGYRYEYELNNEYRQPPPQDRGLHH